MPIIFDLETVAQDHDILLSRLPEWDIEEAKTRVPKNYKKPEAISEWLEQDKANWGKDLIEKAALSPETGRIALAGFWKHGEYTPLMGDEKHLLSSCFTIITGNINQNRERLFGWNLHGYDIPFMVKRAWMLGILVPRSIFDPCSRYPVSSEIIDAMKVWQAGSYKAPFTSLNNALLACGLDGKGNGADFGKLWESDREAAIEYQRQELNQQAKLYERMGLL